MISQETSVASTRTFRFPLSLTRQAWTSCRGASQTQAQNPTEEGFPLVFMEPPRPTPGTELEVKTLQVDCGSKVEVSVDGGGECGPGEAEKLSRFREAARVRCLFTQGVCSPCRMTSSSGPGTTESTTSTQRPTRTLTTLAGASSSRTSGGCLCANIRMSLRRGESLTSPTCWRILWSDSRESK